jgi:DNA-binding response OmpR family regulator
LLSSDAEGDDQKRDDHDKPSAAIDSRAERPFERTGSRFRGPRSGPHWDSHRAAIVGIRLGLSMQDSPTILLVDDEDAIQKLLSFPLQKDGYRVIEARDGEAALRRFDEEKVDLVVLDLALPKLDGLEVCRRLRAHSAVPIIMLTARDEEIDKVIGLEIGADDYITKPFSIREFRSRVRALLRRASLTPSASVGEAIEVGPLRVDRARRRVEVEGKAAELTYVEFELVRILAEYPGRVFPRADLLAEIWGSAQYRDPRTVDVHVRHIREKLERDPAKPELILTVRGVGYRLREP